MQISLRPITRDNWRECTELVVHEDQLFFVAPNIRSLAQAYAYYPELVTRALYADETMVGFLMYTFEREDNSPWIVRFMIGQQYQRRGYGRSALQAAITEVTTAYSSNRLRLSVVTTNHVAQRFYESAGFRTTGLIFDGEEIMELRLAPPANT